MAIKVNNYLKNIAKSFFYAGIEEYKENTKIGKFITNENNQTLAKEVYKGIVDYKGTFRKVTQALVNSKVYQVAEFGYKSSLEDLKSGNFYNTKRREKLNDAAFAGEDFDLDGDLNFDDNFDEGEEPSADAKSTIKALEATAETSTDAIAGAIVDTGKYTAEVSKASTSILVAQQNKLFGELRNTISVTNNSLSNLIGFNDNVMSTHIENSKKYFEATTKFAQENNAILKEMLDMQRVEFKEKEKIRERDRKRNETKHSVSFYDILDSDGLPDLMEYGKVIKNNFTKHIDDLIPVSTFLGQDINSLKSMFANPLGFLVTGAISKIIGQDAKKAHASLDKTFGGIFSNLIAELNFKATNSDNQLVQVLSKIFGVRTEKKSNISTNKYEKGAVPFDGITRKAIVEVIPMYLSRITAALTGNKAVLFDFDAGKWVSEAQVRQDHVDSIKRRKISSTADIEKQVVNAVMSYKKGPKDDFDVDETDIREIAKAAVNYAYRNQTLSGFINHGGLNEDHQKIMAQVMPMIDQRDIASNILQEHLQLANDLKAAEKKGYDIRNIIFNGSKDAFHVNKSDKQSAIGRKVDDFGKDNLFYLRNIYNELIYIRNYSAANLELIGGLNPSGKFGKKRKKGSNYIRSSSVPGNSVANSIIKLKPGMENNHLDDEPVKVEKEKIRKHKHTIEIPKKASDTLDRSIELPIEKEMRDIGRQFKGDKIGTILELASKAVSSPRAFITGSIAIADKALYNLFFEHRYKDKDGNEVSGFFDLLAKKLTDTFDYVKKKFLKPAWKKTKEIVNDFSQAFFGKDFFTEAKESAKKEAKEIGDAVKETVSNTVTNTVKNLETVAKDFSTTFKMAFNVNKPLYAKRYPFGNIDPIIDNSYYTDDSKKPKTELKNLFAGQDPVVSRGFTERWAPGLDLSKLTNYNKTHQSTAFNEAFKKVQDNKKNKEEIKENYNGTPLVEKDAITTISKGEAIIPADLNPFNPDRDKADRKDDRRREEKMKKDFTDKIFSHADGTLSFDGVNTNQLPEIQQDSFGTKAGKFAKNKLKSWVSGLIEGNIKDERTKRTLGEMLKSPAKTIGKAAPGGIIGGVAGGLLFGPFGMLASAALGSAASLLKDSEQFKDFLLGKKDEHGRRTGGLATKKVQRLFKKYAPDLVNVGLPAAAASALLLGTGPLGMAVIGAGASILKNNKSFQETLFGKEYTYTDADGVKHKKHSGGLISKNTRDYIKKNLGTIGATTLGTVMFGPFGALLPNMALGAGLGMLGASKKFTDAVLGPIDPRDPKGEKRLVSAGILGHIRDMFVNPLISAGKSFTVGLVGLVKDTIYRPFKKWGAVIHNEAVHWGKKALNLPKIVFNAIKNAFTDGIGSTFFEKIRGYWLPAFKKVSDKISNIGTTILKWVTLKPLRALGNAVSRKADRVRLKQIDAGRVGSSTALERLEMAKESKSKYKGKELDKKIARMSEEEIEELRGRLLVIRGKSGAKEEYHAARDEFQTQLNRYFRYSQNSNVKKLRERLEEKNLNIEDIKEMQEFITLDRKLPKEDRERFLKLVERYNNRIKVAQKAESKDTALRKNYLKTMGKEYKDLNIDLENEKDLKKLSDMLKNETAFKHDDESYKSNVEDVISDLEKKQVTLLEKISESSRKMVELLSKIDFNFSYMNPEHMIMSDAENYGMTESEKATQERIRLLKAAGYKKRQKFRKWITGDYDADEAYYRRFGYSFKDKNITREKYDQIYKDGNRIGLFKGKSRPMDGSYLVKILKKHWSYDDYIGNLLESNVSVDLIPTQEEYEELLEKINGLSASELKKQQNIGLKTLGISNNADYLNFIKRVKENKTKDKASLSEITVDADGNEVKLATDGSKRIVGSEANADVQRKKKEEDEKQKGFFSSLAENLKGTFGFGGGKNEEKKEGGFLHKLVDSLLGIGGHIANVAKWTAIAGIAGPLIIKAIPAITQFLSDHKDEIISAGAKVLSVFGDILKESATIALNSISESFSNGNFISGFLQVLAGAYFGNKILFGLPSKVAKLITKLGKKGYQYFKNNKGANIAKEAIEEAPKAGSKAGKAIAQAGSVAAEVAGVAAPAAVTAVNKIAKNKLRKKNIDKAKKLVKNPDVSKVPSAVEAVSTQTTAPITETIKDSATVGTKEVAKEATQVTKKPGILKRIGSALFKTKLGKLGIASAAGAAAFGLFNAGNSSEAAVIQQRDAIENSDAYLTEEEIAQLQDQQEDSSIDWKGLAYDATIGLAGWRAFDKGMDKLGINKALEKVTSKFTGGSKQVAGAVTDATKATAKTGGFSNKALNWMKNLLSAGISKVTSLLAPLKAKLPPAMVEKLSQSLVATIVKNGGKYLAKLSAQVALACSGIGTIASIILNTFLAFDNIYNQGWRQWYNNAEVLYNEDLGDDVKYISVLSGVISTLLFSIIPVSLIFKLLSSILGMDLSEAQGRAALAIEEYNSDPSAHPKGAPATVETVEEYNALFEKGLLDSIKDTGASLLEFGKDTVSKMTQAAKSIYKSMGDKAKAAKDWAANNAKWLADNGMNWFKETYDNVSNNIVQLFDSAKDKAKKMYEDLKENLPKPVDSVSKRLSNAKQAWDQNSGLDAATEAVKALFKDPSEDTVEQGTGKLFGRSKNGFYKQTEYADIGFNAPGDSIKQTIGDSGCGPVAAVNAIQALGRGSTTDPVIQASNFALSKGYKGKDTGTDPRFFKDYAKSQNINAKDIPTNNIESELLKGNPVILGGSDKMGTSDDHPFGEYPHYVTATGYDKRSKTVTIQDPESGVNDSRYKLNNVLRKTNLATSYSNDMGMACNPLDSVFGRAKFDMDRNGQYIWNKLMEAGFSNQAAAAVLGTMRQECSLNPESVENGGTIDDSIKAGEGGKGFGLIQWTGSRTKRLKEFCAERKLDPKSLDGQLMYFLYEIDQGYGLLDKLKAAPTVKAAMGVMKEYVKFGIAGDREKFAEEYFKTKGKGINTQSTGGSMTPGGANEPSFGIFDSVFKPLTAMSDSFNGILSGITSDGPFKDISDTASSIFGSLLGGPSTSSSSSGGNFNNPEWVSSQGTPENIKKASEWAESIIEKPQSSVNPPYWFGPSGCTSFMNAYLNKAGLPSMNLNVPALMQEAKAKGFWKDSTQPAVEGDIGVIDTDNSHDEPDHVVIEDGKGGFWSNLSSGKKIGHGKHKDYFGDIWGYIPTGAASNSKGTINTVTQSTKDDAAEAGPTSQFNGKGKFFGRGKDDIKGIPGVPKYTNKEKKHLANLGKDISSSNKKHFGKGILGDVFNSGSLNDAIRGVIGKVTGGNNQINRILDGILPGASSNSTISVNSGSTVAQTGVNKMDPNLLEILKSIIQLLTTIATNTGNNSSNMSKADLEKSQAALANSINSLGQMIASGNQAVMSGVSQMVSAKTGISSEHESLNMNLNRLAAI